jgi:hypothetical protein
MDRSAGETEFEFCANRIATHTRKPIKMEIPINSRVLDHGSGWGTICGVPCFGLNGGDAFKQSEAFSFKIATEDQAETDRYWEAIVGNGGAECHCGWCKDKWGLSWQITPRVLTEAMAIRLTRLHSQHAETQYGTLCKRQMREPERAS